MLGCVPESADGGNRPEDASARGVRRWPARPGEAGQFMTEMKASFASVHWWCWHTAIAGEPPAPVDGVLLHIGRM